MTENKMEQVAALFGKKLGEEFKVRGAFGEYKAYFDKGGFMVARKDLWCANSSLVDLLTGQAEIVED